MNFVLAFFVLSGFCSILYELVWLRLAMAQFGVTTPLVSTVLSTFMAGLGAGSWIAGRLLSRYGKARFPPFRLYAPVTKMMARARALRDSFPYVVVHPSVEEWGWHYFASMTPVPDRTAEELLARMPGSAVKDMMEWGPGRTPLEQLQRVVSKRTTLDNLIALSPQTPALADDRPINEYFLLRTLVR